MTDAQLVEIDMKRLATEILKNSKESALPSNLSDEWLMLLLRDFTEILDHSDEKSAQHTTQAILAPVSVVSYLVMDKLKTNNLSISSEELYRCFKLYRFELEAELMSRKTGLPVIPPTLETIFTNRDFIAGC